MQIFQHSYATPLIGIMFNYNAALIAERTTFNKLNSFQQSTLKSE